MREPGGRYDRRTFLTRSMGGAAALAVGSMGASVSSSKRDRLSERFFAAGATPGVSTGKPRRGGTVTIGMNSEIDGFLPSQSHFDNTGITYANAVFDSLTKIAKDGTARPYLASAVTPNADLTQWTVTLRPGVTFHDGSPLNADVVMANFDAIKSSALTGQAVTPVTGVKVTGDLELQYTCDEPLVAFPQYLSTQVGYVVALAQLGAQNSTHPIGTGPYRFVQWVPNDHFTVERNPAYWRSGIPYLDGITFKPIIDDNSRLLSLRSGTIDLMVSHDPNAIKELQHDKSFAQVNDLNLKTGQPDMDFICLNVTSAPLDDLTVRQALAHATDPQVLVKLFGAGVGVVSTSLFPDGSPYRPAHNGYPSYDVSKAKQLAEQAAARRGGPVTLTLGDIPDPRQVEIIQALQSMWGQAGIHVSLTTVEQVTYIDNLVTGSFQAYADEQFAATDPDLNYVWLSDTTASGPIALNFARNRDPRIEAALQQGRTHPEKEARIEAYQTVDKLLAQDLPYIWVARATWSISGKTTVQNFAGPTFPGGGAAEGFRAGAFSPAQIWVGA